MKSNKLSEVHADLCYNLQQLFTEVERLTDENEDLSEQLEAAKEQSTNKVAIFRKELKNINKSIEELRKIGVEILDFENTDYCIDKINYSTDDDEVYFNCMKKKENEFN